jgi:hypothetical protein
MRRDSLALRTNGRPTGSYRQDVRQERALPPQSSVQSLFEVAKLRKLITPASISPCFSRAERGQVYAGRECDG